MPRNLTVPEDRFAAGLEELLADIPPEMRRGVGKAVKTAIREAKNETKANWAAARKGKGNGTYGGGFSYRTKNIGSDTPSAEMGNERYPGLPHLLEKGHRTIGGMYGGDGFVPGNEHMAPAYDVAVELFEAEIDKAVDAAL